MPRVCIIMPKFALFVHAQTWSNSTARNLRSIYLVDLRTIPPSRPAIRLAKGRVVNGHTTKASNKWVRLPILPIYPYTRIARPTFHIYGNRILYFMIHSGNSVLRFLSSWFSSNLIVICIHDCAFFVNQQKTRVCVCFTLPNIWPGEGYAQKQSTC